MPRSFYFTKNIDECRAEVFKFAKKAVEKNKNVALQEIVL